MHCGQTVGWIKMKRGVHVGLGPAHIVLDGDPAPPLQRGATPPPQFLAHICCGQMARFIKMPLGMEVGLSSGDFLLNGDPAPSQKGAERLIFGSCLLRSNGCMDQDATWYGGRPRLRRHCVRWGLSSLRGKWHNIPSLFGPLCSDMVAYVSNCSALVK